jgi:hypothetical protein
MFATKRQWSGIRHAKSVIKLGSRKDIRVTKKTLQIMDIETLKICCVNTTLIETSFCTQGPCIGSLEPTVGSQEPYEDSRQISVNK